VDEAPHTDQPLIPVWRAEVRRFLAGHLRPRNESSRPSPVALFAGRSQEQEREALTPAREWQRVKFEAGYGAIGLPAERGGRGLGPIYQRVFDEEERAFEAPERPMVLRISVYLVAATLAEYGTPQQRARFLTPLLSGDIIACQLFSEPEAGSDLAGVRTRAARVGTPVAGGPAGWRVTGQKIWTSGAQFADYGELIARTNPDVPKHKGLTAFLLPLRGPGVHGVDIRPIREMAGGTEFNEVFLDGAEVPDELRLGDEGQGWPVALTTLSIERNLSATSDRPGATAARLVEAARRLGDDLEESAREPIVQAYLAERAREYFGAWLDAKYPSGGVPGPDGAVAKLMWLSQLRHTTEAVNRMYAGSLIADDGTEGSEWAAHVLGAPGFRIAGGTEEILHNIIAERALGLPPEPRPESARSRGAAS
jgi:alkylation response protein AidB-like acyl-CoA dehydrogenase